VDESLEQVAGNLQAVKSSIHKMTEEAAEQQDKEGRRNNVVIYKIPESDATRAEDRNKADIDFCLQLFNSCLHVGIDEQDFVNVFRLGRTDESNTNPRPLMVQLERYSLKNLIIESLFKLKSASQKFKGVVVAHDMTVKEWEECKHLVEEAKQKVAMDTSQEYLYRVWGYPGKMKIVQIKSRH